MKERIRNLGKWRRPVGWAVVAAGTVCLLLAVSLATGTDRARREEHVSGLVTQVQVGEDGAMSALVIQPDRGEELGVLLTEESVTYPLENGNWTLEEARAIFQAAMGPDRIISAECVPGKKRLTTEDGAEITAYEARSVCMEGQLCRNAVTMADGTELAVEENYRRDPSRTYYLADGTRLLTVTHPDEPDYFLDGPNGLNETAKKEVLAYYEARGTLYDEGEELEAAYARYLELGEKYRAGQVEQYIYPSASSDRVMYFRTNVVGTDGQGGVGFGQMIDAFERETGAHIDMWDLFTVPREEVKQVLLDGAGVLPLREEMEAAPWDGHIELGLDDLDVYFEGSDLPGSDVAGAGFSVDYTPAVRAILHDWAIPTTTY